MRRTVLFIFALTSLGLAGCQSWAQAARRPPPRPPPPWNRPLRRFLQPALRLAALLAARSGLP